MWSSSVQVGEQELSFETGIVARQADGAVLARQGGLTLLTTVTSGHQSRGVDFLPLTVEYRFRMASAGRIPGGFLRREARASDREVLTSRLVDRSLRPLFASGYDHDTQVIITVLSYDPGGDLATLAISSAALALAISDIPFSGPVAGLRVGRLDGRLVAAPGEQLRPDLELDLVLAARPEGLIMAEGHARELSEREAMDALNFGAEQLGPLFELCERARVEVGRPKRAVARPAPLDAALLGELEQQSAARFAEVFAIADKRARGGAQRALEASLRDQLDERCQDPDRLIGALRKKLIRERTVAGSRLDGRGSEDIRPISSRVSWLPGAHGSSLFTRGETQAVVTCTLGSDRDSQLIETPTGPHYERFLLHYNFPPYSVGEVRPLRGPGRREIGHGHLARSALAAVLPSPDAFPYTLRVESTITESNGSSSMATVCGGCLALMDAGVPLARPVAGIAMGLMSVDGRDVVLSDILGDEDHVGDMDFKVAGSAEGITAIQLDNKLGSIPAELMSRAFEQARRGRLYILERMTDALSAPRAELAAGVPRSLSVQVPQNRIRSLIGPGGRNIKRVESQSGAQVKLGDDGVAKIFAADSAALDRARVMIEELTGLPKLGETYLGEVTGVRPQGAFVRLFEGIDGRLEARALAGRAVTNGDKLKVTVSEVDERGRILLELAAP